MKNALAYLGGVIVVLGVTLYLAEGFIMFWPYSGILALVVVPVVAWSIYKINKSKEEI